MKKLQVSGTGQGAGWNGKKTCITFFCGQISKKLI